MSEKFAFGVFIGRFQPFHNGHRHALSEAFSRSERVIMVLGSAFAPRSIKNPFTFDERVALIKSSTPPEWHDKLTFLPVRDYHYNDEKWTMEVRNKVFEVARHEHCLLIGHAKDDSSYYLNLFPEYAIKLLEDVNPLNATDVRTSLFDMGAYSGISWSTQEWLSTFRGTPAYDSLREEFRFVKAYKDAWANAPYPPIFSTVDAVVECDGHFLLIERGGSPGKGQIALPGGFINQNERLLAACIRELKEETSLNVTRNELQAQDVFDYPGRSLRGRTITHGFYFKVGSDAMRTIRSGDDANRCFWMAWPDLYKNEDKFYEDHFHILQRFICK